MESGVEDKIEFPAVLAISYYDRRDEDNGWIAFNATKLMRPVTAAFAISEAFVILQHAIKENVGFKPKTQKLECEVNAVRYRVSNQRELEGVLELARVYRILTLKFYIMHVED